MHEVLRTSDPNIRGITGMSKKRASVNVELHSIEIDKIDAYFPIRLIVSMNTIIFLNEGE